MNTAETIYETGKLVLAAYGLWKLGQILVQWISPLVRRMLAKAFRTHMTPAAIKRLVGAYNRSWGAGVLFKASVGRVEIEYPFLANPEWLFQSELRDDFVSFRDSDHSNLPVDWAFLIRKKLAHRLWNGDLFFLDGFENSEDGRYRMTVGVGKYYQFVSECKRNEQYSMALKEDSELPKQWPNLGSNRDFWPVKAKAAGIGVVGVTVGPTDQYGTKYAVIMQKRTHDTVGGGGLWCPCPTFAFQPFVDGDPTSSLSLKHQLYREIAEEYYGRAEAQVAGGTSKQGRVPLASKFNYYEGINDIEASLNGGKSTLHFLGFGLDGANLEPTFALLLWIKEPDVFARLTQAIRGNWENSDVEVVNIDGNFLETLLSSYQMTCSGAFAVSRAIDFMESQKSKLVRTL